MKRTLAALALTAALIPTPANGDDGATPTCQEETGSAMCVEPTCAEERDAALAMLVVRDRQLERAERRIERKNATIKRLRKALAAQR